MEIINKITVKNVCGNPRKLLGNLPSIPLMMILGYANSCEPKKSKFKAEGATEDEYNTMFKGQFKAQDINTKKWYFAGECYLPSVISNLVEAQVKASRGEVQFAFIIGIKENEDIAIGYQYTAQSLIPQEAESDPFTAIENKVKQFQALPAPSAEPAKQAIAADEVKDHLWNTESNPAPQATKPA